jgi:lipopolysaccharide biosynthesis glycosyltransferase
MIPPRSAEAAANSRLATLAFCADAYMEAPLHVAASSALRNLHPGWAAKIYLLAEGIDAKGIARLRETLNRCERPYELVEITGADTSVFSRLRPFHGTLAAYFRLLLPDFISEQKFLYLDTDTVTTIDLSPLFALDMGGYPLVFVVDGVVKNALDCKIYIQHGAVADDPCFNSGVILFNVEQWKAQNCLSRVLEFGNAYPDCLLAADQTVLNILFAKDCCRLSPEFNVKLSTHVRDPIPEKGIYHFVGSPKPWDILGEFFHPYHDIWDEAIQCIALRFVQRSAYTDHRSWIRFTRILGGYRRILRVRYQLAKAERRKRQAVSGQQ